MKVRKGRAAPSSRRSSGKRADKATGDALIESLAMAVRHARGEIELPGYRLIAGRDVRRLRTRQGLTRKAFADSKIASCALRPRALDRRPNPHDAILRALVPSIQR